MATGGRDPGDGEWKKSFFNSLKRAFSKKGRKQEKTSLLKSYDTETSVADMEQTMAGITDAINGPAFEDVYRRVRHEVSQVQTREIGYRSFQGAMMKIDEYRRKLNNDIQAIDTELNNRNLSAGQAQQLSARVERLRREATYLHSVLSCINAERFCVEQILMEQQWFNENLPNQPVKRPIFEITYLAHSGTMMIDMDRKFKEYTSAAKLFNRSFREIYRDLQSSPQFPGREELFIELRDIYERLRTADDDMQQLSDNLDRLPDDEIERQIEITTIAARFMRAIGRIYQWNVRLYQIDQMRRQGRSELAAATVGPSLIDAPLEESLGAISQYGASGAFDPFGGSGASGVAPPLLTSGAIGGFSAGGISPVFGERSQSHAAGAVGGFEVRDLSSIASPSRLGSQEFPQSFHAISQGAAFGSQQLNQPFQSSLHGPDRSFKGFGGSELNLSAVAGAAQSQAFPSSFQAFSQENVASQQYGQQMQGSGQQSMRDLRQAGGNLSSLEGSFENLSLRKTQRQSRFGSAFNIFSRGASGSRQASLQSRMFGSGNVHGGGYEQLREEERISVKFAVPKDIEQSIKDTSGTRRSASPPPPSHTGLTPPRSPRRRLDSTTVQFSLSGYSQPPDPTGSPDEFVFSSDISGAGPQALGPRIVGRVTPPTPRSSDSEPKVKSEEVWPWMPNKPNISDDL